MISVIITIVLIGVIMWAVNAYIPMSEPLKKILNVVVVILVILWLLSVFGVYSLPSRVN